MLNKSSILIFILGISFTLFAQNTDESGGKFSGYMFGDYYYFADNHNAEIKDKHGFQFRRIYFTYDYRIDKNFSTRIRFEMANKFDFDDAAEMNAVVKDASLKYKFSKHQLILGITSPPTFELIEEIWGYRSVEKTPLDLQKFASSRDFGLAFRGQLDENGMVKYHAMFGNGSSNKHETDKGKSGMFAISLYPVKQLALQIYGDYTGKAGDTDWITLQGFAGFVSDKFRAGAQYTSQTRNMSSADDLILRIGSVFLVANISDQVSLLGRVDRQFDPNPGGEKIDYIPFDKNSKSTLFIGGVDWHPINYVSIIPNIEFVKYDESDAGVTPQSDVLVKLTFNWQFK
jgi:hypothetical protein